MMAVATITLVTITAVAPRLERGAGPPLLWRRELLDMTMMDGKQVSGYSLLVLIYRLTDE